MQNKKTILAVVAAVLAVAVLLGVWLITRPQGTAGKKEFTVTVVHGDGTSKEFSYKSNEEFLGTVLVEDGLIQGDMGDYGMYIKVVDGEQAIYEEDGAYWAFYIGEEYGMTGVDQTPIEDGAAYRLEYTVG